MLQDCKAVTIYKLKTKMFSRSMQSINDLPAR